MLKRLNLKSEFAQSVMVLTTGTVLSQLIGYALAPVITRLYLPEELGEFDVYLRMVTLIAAIATARYELSLPLPKKDHHSFQLFRLSVRIGLITTGITILGVLIYLLFAGFGFKNAIYGSALVMATFFFIFFNTGTNWAIRVKAFRRISIAKLLQSGSNNILRVVFGYMKLGWFGLVIAYVVGLFASTSFFFIDYMRNRRKEQFVASPAKMRVLSKTYNDFPRINMPHVLMDTGREFLVALLIVYAFDQAIFGAYSHSLRMLKIPMMVVGAALGQVFFNRCSELFNEGKKIYPLVRKMMVYLTLFSIVPFAVVYFVGEELFAWVFSQRWRESGVLSEIMVPWLLLNFIASPLSTLPIVVGKQKSFFFLALVSTVLQLAGFGLLPYIMDTKVDGYKIFYIVSLSQAVVYLAIMYYLLNLAKNADRTNNVVHNSQESEG